MFHHHVQHPNDLSTYRLLFLLVYQYTRTYPINQCPTDEFLIQSEVASIDGRRREEDVCHYTLIKNVHDRKVTSLIIISYWCTTLIFYYTAYYWSPWCFLWYVVSILCTPVVLDLIISLVSVGIEVLRGD